MSAEQIVEIEDRHLIEDWARQDLGLHIYEVGDLDLRYWPHTRWFGLQGPRGLEALALLYTGTRMPTLLALTRRPSPAHARLLIGVADRLPSPLYAHLGPGLVRVFEKTWRIEDHGRHHKMVLRGDDELDDYEDRGLEHLDRSKLDELQGFYERAYPGNWFSPEMLDSGQYLGLRKSGQVVSAAGVHVYSPRFRVAALGNVATDPAWRGQGLANRVVTGLCRRLLEQVETIGLNVHADNRAAIRCYTSLGFEVLSDYWEYELHRV